MDAGHFLTLPDDFKDVYEEEEIQEDDYDDYYESDGDGSGFYCKKCNHRSFASRAGLLEHIHLHTGTKRFNCNFCDAGFNHKYKLTQHIIVRHSSNPNPNYCNLCEKGFSRSDHLRRHLQFHYGKKDPVTDHKFLCPVCLIEFKDEKEINTHIKDHVDEAHQNIPQDHKICVLCGAVLTCRTISAHMSSCHMVTDTVKVSTTYDKMERLKFTCQSCDFSAITKKKLRDHFRYKHEKTKEGPWTCTYCDKVFSSKSGFKTHTLMHTMERPPIVLEYENQCPKCGLIKGRTGDVRVLNKHLKKCKGKKPFACELCHQSFLRKDWLVAHMKKGDHSNFATTRQKYLSEKSDLLSTIKPPKKCEGKKRFQCDLCPLSYNKNSNLNAHKRNKHPTASTIFDSRLLPKSDGLVKNEHDLGSLSDSYRASMIEHAKLAVAAKDSTLVQKKSTPVETINVEGIKTDNTPSRTANASTPLSLGPLKTSARSGRTIVTPRKYSFDVQDYFDSENQDFKVDHSNLDQIIKDFEDDQEKINEVGEETINEEGEETNNEETENDIKNLIANTATKPTNKMKRYVCPKCECPKTDRRHMERCKGKKKYQCDLCPISYDRNFDLNTHKRKKHPNAATIFDLRLLTKSDRLAIDPNKVEDSKSVGKNSNLNSRKRKKHAATASNVDDENETYITPDVYMDNAESDIEEDVAKVAGSFSCYFCWRTFSDLTDARVHILTQHATKNPRNVKVNVTKLQAKTLLKYLM